MVLYCIKKHQIIKKTRLPREHLTLKCLLLISKSVDAFLLHLSILLKLIVTEVLKAVTNLLPGCEVGIRGNRGLEAHCSARDNRREESSVSGWALEK